MYLRLAAIPLLLLGAWTPAPAPQADGAIVKVQQRDDFNWAPPAYSLSTTSDSGANGINNLNHIQGYTPPTTPQCVPARGAKLAEGACQNGVKAVSYSDGCGSTMSGSESCPTGQWTYFWAGGGQCAWVCTSSIYRLACVVPGTQTKLPADSCGPMTKAEQCMVGYSYGDTYAHIPACPAEGEYKIAVGGPTAMFP